MPVARVRRERRATVSVDHDPDSPSDARRPRDLRRRPAGERQNESEPKEDPQPRKSRKVDGGRAGGTPEARHRELARVGGEGRC